MGNNLEVRLESEFVTRDSLREELDLFKNKLQFIQSQTFNKRQCTVGLGFFIVVSVAVNIVLGVLLVKNQVGDVACKKKYFDLKDFLKENDGKMLSKLKNRFIVRRNCKNTTWLNDFDQEFDYKCPGNKVLIRAASYHSNSEEDRRWKFECCDLVLDF